ncbi:MAG: nucleotidyltransferase family protein, partial [Anaeroplasma sp.]
KHALNNSVDLVIELPFIYSTQRADIFAKNAVDILNYFKVDEIWIGSEENNIELYKKCYELDTNPSLDNGISYKAAKMNQMSLASNDILGYGYYKAIKNNSYNIRLNTIKRISSNYLDKLPSDKNITSALAIRSNINLIYSYCPSFVVDDFHKILDENKLFSFLKYKILSSTANELKEIFFVDEGIENKLFDIYKYDNLNDFINHLTSKRYTSTRIKRMLIYVLTNVKKVDINQIQNIKIPYCRVLGYNQKGKEYLNTIKKEIIIYTNIKNNLHYSLDIELRISKLFDFIFNLDLFRLEQKGPIEK